MEAEAAGAPEDGVAVRVLARQEQLLGWQIASERAGFVLKVLTAAAGAAAAAGLGALAWAAHNSAGLVVEPFSVPPQLAARGVTGQALAARTLDALRHMQADTQNIERQVESGDSWGREARVEIPSTGVSVTELQQLLREWLGREQHVSGELSTDGATLTLSIRTGETPGDRITVPAAQLDQLVVKGAESIYGASRPFLYAGYLRDRGRKPEADVILDRLSVSGPRAQRARALTQRDFQDPAAKRAALRRAIALDPGMPLAWQYLAYLERESFHPEAAVKAARKARQLWNGPRRNDYAPWFANLSRNGLEGLIARELGDRLGHARASEREAEPTADQTVSACRQCGSGALINAAFSYANVGDAAAMRDALRRATALNPQPQFDGAVAQATAAVLALAIDDPATAAAIFDDPVRGAAAAAGVGPEFAAVFRTFAYGGVGRAAAARAAISTTPLDCYLCVVMRGVAETAARDWRAADHWFAEARRLGPSLPAAHTQRGRRLLQRGDTDGAIAEFAAAHRLGPNSADPLELWGEALLRQGDAKAAAGRFAAAEPHAPRWGRLHLNWGKALAKLGDRKAADARLKQAAGMDLSPADRAELSALMR